MKNLKIQLLQEKDLLDVFQFEKDNRIFFESIIPGRGDSYYEYSSYEETMHTLLKEQQNGQSYFYLIRDSFGKLIGRINLVDIDTERNFGYLGYRIAENMAGKGIVTSAVNWLLSELQTSSIKKVLAKTTKNNLPSQRVLEKCGFEKEEERAKEKEFLFYNWTKGE